MLSMIISNLFLSDATEVQQMENFNCKFTFEVKGVQSILAVEVSSKDSGDNFTTRQIVINRWKCI